MVCQRIPMPGGSFAIACGPRQRPKRCSGGCGRPGTLLCDWKVPGNPGGTCNAPICEECATSPAAEKDICPTHAPALAAWLQQRGQR